MTKRSFFLSTLLGLAGLPVVLYSAPQAQTGVIQGVIVRRGTNTPVPDVRVTLTGAGGGVLLGPAGEIIPVAPAPGRGTPGTAQPPGTTPPFQSAVTDSAGRFTFSGVPVGPARVRAQLEGFFGPLLGADYASFVASNVTVAADRPATVILSLIPAATITGRVTNAAARPVAGAAIEIFRLGYEEGSPRFSPVWPVGAQSDDRGEYRLHSLPPGQYFVSANPMSAALSGTVRTTTRDLPVQTFYPDTTDPTSAKPLVLSDGTELRGIDIRIGTVLTGTISGKFVSTLPPGVLTGGPLGVRPTTPVISMVRVDAPLGAEEAVVSGIEPDAEGNFEIRNVRSGTYDIIARLPIAANNGWAPFGPPSRAPAPWAWGRTRIEMRNGVDVQGVSLVVRRGLDLKGRLIVEGNSPRPNVRISLIPESVSSPKDGVGQQIFGQISAFTPVIEPDGSFLIPLLPEGKYRFRITFEGSPTAYLADIRQGAVSVYDNDLTVGNAEINPVDVVVNTNGGSVQGTVLGKDQKPIRATVVLVPQENRRQNSALYKQVRSDAQGRYQLEAIAPGPYRLFAWEAVQDGVWQSAEFLARNQQYGASVTIGGGARVSVDVTAAPDAR
jgi:protocatechuate 3,4-dioxygenase beta subunit